MYNATVVNETHNLAAPLRKLATWTARILWAGWIPLVLFLVFFTGMPDIHNAMHGVRHSSTFVQCH